MSQTALAEQVGITSQYLSNIERGRENPTFDTLVRIAKYLKVQPYELLSFEPLDESDPRVLRATVERLLKETKDEDRLRMLARVLRAIVY